MMPLGKCIAIRMDKQMARIINRAAKQSGMTLHVYIRHVLRSGLGLKRKPKLFLAP